MISVEREREREIYEKKRFRWREEFCLDKNIKAAGKRNKQNELTTHSNNNSVERFNS